MAAAASARALLPPTIGAAFRQELARFIVEPDARQWMLASLQAPSVNAKYWSEAARCFAMGQAAYHDSLKKEAVRLDLLWLWRQFRRAEGAFAQVAHERWSSIFGSVYAIRAMRMYLHPSQSDVPNRDLLGEDIVASCLKFVRDLWRAGTFIDGHRGGASGERSLTKLYYAVTLLHLLKTDDIDHTLTDLQWKSVLLYLKGCISDSAERGIGFEYDHKSRNGGWACTTYYGVRLLRHYRELRGFKDPEDFTNHLETFAGIDIDVLKQRTLHFMGLCWQPNRGCGLSPADRSVATLNHTYMFIRVLQELNADSGETDSKLEQLPEILSAHEATSGGYALTPEGIPNVASTYVATRLWQLINDRGEEIREDAKRKLIGFLQRCQVNEDGYSGYHLIEQGVDV